jgi:alkylation response protein AidB-like acyl-CoA dehydrogenase
VFLELDEQQRALRDVTRELLADLDPLERLRDGEPEPRRKAWECLAAAGLTGLGVSEELGGSGGSEVEAAVAIEQAGGALLPEPLRESVGIVAPMLCRYGTERQRERWLEPLAAGEALLGVAVGSRRALAGHAAVDAVLLIDEGRCLVVPREGLEMRPVPTADPSRGLALVEHVEADDDDVLPGASGAETVTRGAAATAAALVGVAQRLVDVAVEHAGTRHQFGSPVGSFQAVQHPLVDAHVAVETARTASWYAALALRDDAPDAARAARVAKAAADEASATADRVALQVLAGIGFTWEHELHWLSKRAAAWRAEFGDLRQHRRALATDLLDREGPHGAR